MMTVSVVFLTKLCSFIVSVILFIIVFTVLIPAFIGLEQSIYITDEGGGTVEICAALTVGNNSNLMDLDPTFIANLNFMTSEDSAIGTASTQSYTLVLKGYHMCTQSITAIPRSCCVTLCYIATQECSILHLEASSVKDSLLFVIAGGEDYSDITMMFSLTPNNGRECFNVSITNDNIFELNEYFNASLDAVGSLPPGASLGITEARVRIIDDEGTHTMLLLLTQYIVFTY